MTDTRERAREYRERVRDNYVLRIVGAGLATMAEYDEPAIMAAFAESEAALARNQERMEIAKLLCSECAKGDKPERFSNKELGIHEWVHTMLGFDDRNENCSADAIHERNLAETGETK